MKIAIIGSGASGLTAIKCCLDEGLQPVCFEKQRQIGGVWNYVPGKKDGSTVYKSTVINTSKEMMCFSDYPIPQEFPNFMHNTYVCEYFKLYAEKFNLRKHIQFNTLVISCKQADGFRTNGNWLVQTKNIETGKTKTEYYDGVLVCVGHHAIPNYPLEAFPGIEKFKGKYMHSHDYRDHRGFEDLRVAVVGIGNSGGDISVELSRQSKQVFLSTRRGAWILYRIHEGGLPTDLAITSRFMSAMPDILPASFMNWGAKILANRRFDHAKYGLAPEHPFFSQHPNVCDDMPNRIITGSLQIKGNVIRFTENTAVFEDGSEEEIDAVVFCTGYSFDYPFLDESVVKVEENDCELYKFMWPTTLPRHTLAIIGGIQPWGAINPISEMQCRWATRVFKGDAMLPSLNEMKKDAKKKRSEMQKRYVKSRRHTIQVDYVNYMDQLASQISCKPRPMKYLLTDPVLAFKVLFGPAVPYHYRLSGPGKWPGARKAIMTVMERTLYPLQTRKVVKKGSNVVALSFVVLVFVLLMAWILNLF